jgi:transcriptional regulator with XRE-family HTH domain
MTEPEDFGPGLRLERERKGISLAAVAEHTKVSASLFAALERDDLSRWPGGIYRKAFVRGYAEAIGLDPDDVLRRFAAAFPADGEGPPPLEDAGAPAAPGAAPLRLTLAFGEGRPARGARRRLGERLLMTGGDLAIPGVVAALGAVVHGAEAFWSIFGLGTAGYLAATGLLTGASPLALLLQRRRRDTSLAAPQAPSPGAPRRSRESVPAPRRLRAREHRPPRHTRRV